MATRINWINFGQVCEVKIQSEKEQLGELIFSALEAGRKKELVLGTLKISTKELSSEVFLHQKILRLTKHIEIDDRANSSRIIAELLLLLENSQDSRKFENLTNFLRALKLNL